MKIQMLKFELKVIVDRIRNLGKQTKAYQKEHGGCHGTIGYMLGTVQKEYRHKHIAYCLLRGRTMEQIERKTRPDNKPDQSYIQLLLEKYAEPVLPLEVNTGVGI